MPAGLDIDWIVISLKRTPDRLEQFFANNAPQKLPIETLEAVDGLQQDRDELIRNGLMAPDLTWSDGAVGAALSHRLCWLKAVESGRPLAIFEDDVVLRGDFSALAFDALRRLPEDWDIIVFGFNTDSALEVEIVPGCATFGDFGKWYPTPAEVQRFVQTEGKVTTVRLFTCFGSCAYAVSPRGAQRLLDGSFPLSWTHRLIRAFNFVLEGQGIDAVMHSLYDELKAYAVMPPIALPRNDKSTSTVGA